MRSASPAHPTDRLACGWDSLVPSSGGTRGHWAWVAASLVTLAFVLASPCTSASAGTAYSYDRATSNVQSAPTSLQAARVCIAAVAPANAPQWSAPARFAAFAAEEAAPLFGQTTASAVFRNGTFAGRTIGDVAAALRAGDATAADLPVDVIVRNGETIGLNTRSMLALRRAGIPVNDWVINDVTGNPAMERLLTERLARNGTNGGTGLLRITGAGPNASSLR
jgi:hypothetical protein